MRANLEIVTQLTAGRVKHLQRSVAIVNLQPKSETLRDEFTEVWFITTKKRHKFHHSNALEGLREPKRKKFYYI